MAPVSKSSLTVVKMSARQLNPAKLQQQIDHIQARAIGATRAARGWTCKMFEQNFLSPKQNHDQTYEYTVKLALRCNPTRPREPSKVEAELNQILEVVREAGRKNSWQLLEHGGQNGHAISAEQKFAEARIPEDWPKYFNHLYEREDQISIVLSAVHAGINSGWQDRYHSVMVGPPAGGKSEILACVKALVGEDAVLQYDATATTQAGAIKDLDNRAEIPRIMLIEEIEKVDENSLRWLLGVLDHRAEIRKVTARHNIHKEVRLLCLATVNNYELFGNMMFGALASRFPHHIWCPKPSRDVLQKILTREVLRTSGRKKWIEPTLEYADSRQITDPRRLIAICLCGRDYLLDGSYQKVLDRTSALKHFGPQE